MERAGTARAGKRLRKGGGPDMSVLNRRIMRRQSDKKTKQVRIGSDLHQKLKVKAARERVTIRECIEQLIELARQRA